MAFRSIHTTYGLTQNRSWVLYSGKTAPLDARRTRKQPVEAATSNRSTQMTTLIRALQQDLLNAVL